jgi:hypothetical protein
MACVTQTATCLLKSKPRADMAGDITAVVDILCPAAMGPTSISGMVNAIRTAQCRDDFRIGHVITIAIELSRHAGIEPSPRS